MRDRLGGAPAEDCVQPALAPHLADLPEDGLGEEVVALREKLLGLRRQSEDVRRSSAVAARRRVLDVAPALQNFEVLSHALLRHAERVGQIVRRRSPARAQLVHDTFARSPKPVFESGYHDAFHATFGPGILSTARLVNLILAFFRRKFSGYLPNSALLNSTLRKPDCKGGRMAKAKVKRQKREDKKQRASHRSLMRSPLSFIVNG